MVTGLSPNVGGVGPSKSLTGAVNGPSVPDGCVGIGVHALVVTAKGAPGMMIAAAPDRPMGVEWA